jgi:hypothetical protein
MDNTLQFTVVSRGGRRALSFPVRTMWNGGWAGRDQEAVRKHAEELAHMGIAPPTTTPIYFPLTNNVVTTSDSIQVTGDQTSGEIEWALLFADDGQVYVTVASDHTDRAAERHGIQLSKQMCPNVLAPEAWPYDEVKDHWESLRMRCHVSKGRERTLYQDAAAAELLGPEDWLPRLAAGIRRPGLVFLSGTPPTVGGLVYGDEWEIELADPLLDRAIRHRYAVEVLGPGHQ